MSLLGIDAGTTGCKAALFSLDGRLLALAYEEYDIRSPQPGWAELDAVEVWEKVKATVRRVTAAAGGPGSPDPVTALAVSSLGEAVVPVSADRRVLGPSILNFDGRGEEFLPGLRLALDSERLYRLNGNVLGNHYGLTKLMWIRAHQPEVYARAHKFLLWSGFLAYLFGGEPAVDHSLANRTLLFDLHCQDWSPELLALSGLDREKLPDLYPSGTVIGCVSTAVAAELGLPDGVAIVTGAHDQCACAVGCGAVEPGSAVYGMGTFLCITPVFAQPPPAQQMLARGLNTEHHAAPGRYVSFIYNQGGSLLKWYRDTFAAADHARARAAGRDIYAELIAEMPSGPGRVVVLPHFSVTGPPDFISDSSGVIAGLRLETTRGEVLRGILEGATFYLKECVDNLPATGIDIAEYRAVGGGSKSDAWIQLSADILGRPFARPAVTEAGALGAAILAGVGHGAFASVEDGVAALVRLERRFEPDPALYDRYREAQARYAALWPAVGPYLQSINRI